MNFDDFYKEVYDQDNPETDSHGWIQWKGTSVCIDIHCECGCHSHIDADFMYYVSCPECKRKFAVGQNIKLIPLNDEQAKHAESRHYFITGDDD